MVQLTGTFTRLDGSPASGSVKITPSRSPIMDSTGQVVISGPQVFPLDKDGKISVQIPASNDPDLGPAFTYAVQVVLDHALWKISKVWIPYGSTTVDLSEVSDFEPTPGVATRVVTIPADGEDGQVLVWDGSGFSWMDAPAGPPGPPGEVTTAALTTALAGKVTGTGMSVRVDTTVGTRVLLDHPGGTTTLMGDTGWRDIRGLLISGWTADALLIRRTTHEVILRALNLDGSSATADWVARGLPSGLFPEPTLTVLPTASTDGVSRLLFLRPGGTDFSLPRGAKYGSPTAHLEVRWTPRQSWPTTLPGLPV